MEALDLLLKEKMHLLEERSKNLPPSISKRRKEIKDAVKLKSDLKKSTAFVKKLKVINSDGLQQCIRECETLNLNLYVSEIVTSLLEMNIKATDIPGLVKLCAALHIRYEEFVDPFVTSLKEAVLKPLQPGNEEAAKQRRLQIRLLIDLYQIGLFDDFELFRSLLINVTGKTKPNGTKLPIDLAGLTVFVKYGVECLFGKPPRKLLDIVDKVDKRGDDAFIAKYVKLVAPDKFKDELNILVDQAFETLSADLVKWHKQAQVVEKRMEKEKMIQGGNLSEAKQGELDQTRRVCERLMSTVSTLSELLLKEAPNLEVEEENSEESSGISVWEGDKASNDYGPFGDGESRMFYEDLPDLISMIPLVVFGFTSEQAQAIKESWKVKKSIQFLGESAVASAETAATVSASGNTSVKATNDSISQIMSNVDKQVDANEPVPDGPLDGVDDESAAKENGEEEGKTNKLLILLQEKLPECTNKIKADEFCVSFCYVTTKNARKKVTEALFRVPRTRYELIPNYARIVASLSRIYPTIGVTVVECLFKEFYGIFKAKTTLYLENKIKNIRYIGELVKFGVAAPIVAFKVFNLLLSDFSDHNIDMFAALLESCGRYLYVLSFTSQRISTVVDTMQRLRKVKKLDLWKQSILDSAYFTVKPPENALKAKKEYSKIQKYIRYLFHEKLCSGVSVFHIVRLLRQLPWDNCVTGKAEAAVKSDEGVGNAIHTEVNVEDEVIKTCLKVCRTKYIDIPLIARVVLGISKYHPNVAVNLIDRLFENIQRALETPHRREPQRTLGYMRLLGQLKIYGVVSSLVVFKCLYRIINFGHEVHSSEEKCTGVVIGYDPMVVSEYDPVNDLFRAQMVVELVNCCAHVWLGGVWKTRLNTFLMYFQRYLLSKSGIPMHIEFSLLDMLDGLEEGVREKIAKQALDKMRKTRNKAKIDLPREFLFARYTSMEAVQAAVDAFEADNHPCGDMLSLNLEQHDPDQENDNEKLDDDGDGECLNPEEEGDEEENLDERDDVNDEDSESDSEDDSEDEDDGEDSTGRKLREEAHALEKLRRAEEEDEFDKAFRNMLQDSISSAKSVARGVDTGKMAIPGVIPRPKNLVNIKQFVNNSDSDSDGSGSSDDGSDGGYRRKAAPKVKHVPFKLLSRDSRGKVESRALFVPESSTMVTKLQKQESLIKQEKQKMKEMTLQFHEQRLQSNACTQNEDREASLSEIYGVNKNATVAVKPNSAASGESTRKPASSVSVRGVISVGGVKSNLKTNASSSTGTPGVHKEAHVNTNNAIVKSNATERARRTFTGGRMDEVHKAADTLNMEEFLATSVGRSAPAAPKPAPVIQIQKKKTSELDTSAYIGL